MKQDRGAAFAIVLGASIAPTLALADGTLSAGSDCGGDAFSSAQVIERRPARRGPITAMPQTLCADLVPQRPATNVDIQAYPLQAYPLQAYPLIAPENGSGRLDAPYDGRRR